MFTGLLLIRVSECDSSLFPLRINILLKLNSNRKKKKKRRRAASAHSLASWPSVRKD